MNTNGHEQATKGAGNVAPQKPDEHATGHQPPQSTETGLARHFFRASAEDFKKIPGSPVAYWLSPLLRSAFDDCPSISNVTNLKQGMSTTDSDRFVRRWTELSLERIDFGRSHDAPPRLRADWYPFNKGGDYRKWYGNGEYVVHYEDDGQVLIDLVTVKYPRISDPEFVIKNRKHYFKAAITYTSVSSAYFGVRFLPEGYIFSVAGPAVLAKEGTELMCLSFLCSKLASLLMSAINPTLGFQGTDVGKLPFASQSLYQYKSRIDTIASQLIEISRDDWNFFEASWDFQTLPILKDCSGNTSVLESSYAGWAKQIRSIIGKAKRLEEENNRVFIDAYGLAGELTPDVPIVQITLTVNPAYRYGGNLTEEEQWTRFREDTIQELLSYAVGCMMGRYSLDKPGLVLASQGETVEDYLFRVSDRTEPYDEDRAKRDLKSVVLMEDAKTSCSACGKEMSVPDARFVIAGEESDTGEVRGRPLVYCAQCADHDRASYVTWQQPLSRFSLQQALERNWCETETLVIFLGLAGCFGHRVPATPETVRFMPDDDGVIPLTDYAWFDDDATNRFVEFIGVAWPKEHLEENLDFVAESLGTKGNESSRDTIRRYLATGFFKDHLQTYKKRPIYWLFTSGKQRAFQCLVYLHRYHEGTLARMRTEYVIPLQGQIAARMEHLNHDIAAATSTAHGRKLQKEHDTLKKQLEELRTFDEKLNHYAAQRIALDLDDGVKVNYGKFGDLLAEVKGITGKAPSTP
jgi:hypothetical protein